MQLVSANQHQPTHTHGCMHARTYSHICMHKLNLQKSCTRTDVHVFACKWANKVKMGCLLLWMTSGGGMIAETFGDVWFLFLVSDTKQVWVSGTFFISSSLQGVERDGTVRLWSFSFLFFLLFLLLTPMCNQERPIVTVNRSSSPGWPDI